ncbi:unnamed protein product [Parascedosporium putredinis]|uniref:Uncharacterized protein n=1 Tax=Parascedosporium putredinis TaxID=1442378 RepID=A0A9P1GZI0_9PEZI|nr:unnamed protein product [Parascedosporium putredinis]CAI7990858.1 unnamed protein product [Parascedosporium putredinis]
MVEKFDLVIVGAGWNGLSMAHTYMEAHPNANIVILDYARSLEAMRLTSEPSMPFFSGLEEFGGHIFHAKDFKLRAKDIATWFPGDSPDDPALQAQVRGEISKWAPVLNVAPVRELPRNVEIDLAATKEQKSPHSSPYRLYRFLVPYGEGFIQQKNFAIIGAHITIHTAIISQAQALWITAFFGDKIPHLRGPGTKHVYDKIKHDTWFHTEFERVRRPKETGGAGERYPDLVADSIPYVDMLLSDLGLSYHRKQNIYRELLEPYQIADYKGLAREWMRGEGR